MNKQKQVWQCFINAQAFSAYTSLNPTLLHYPAFINWLGFPNLVTTLCVCVLFSFKNLFCHLCSSLFPWLQQLLTSILMLVVSIFIHLTLKLKPPWRMSLWGSLHWVGSWNRLLLKSLPTPVYCITISNVYKLFAHTPCLYSWRIQTAYILDAFIDLLIHSLDLENATNKKAKKAVERSSNIVV